MIFEIAVQVYLKLACLLNDLRFLDNNESHVIFDNSEEVKRTEDIGRLGGQPYDLLVEAVLIHFQIEVLVKEYRLTRSVRKLRRPTSFVLSDYFLTIAHICRLLPAPRCANSLRIDTDNRIRSAEDLFLFVLT